MFKKVFASFFVFNTPAISCQSLQWEVLQGDFSFIVDTKNNTAFLRHIYIATGEKKKIVVPSEVTDGLNYTYKVTTVADYAVKEVFEKITDLELPETLEDNETNKKTLELLKKLKEKINETNETKNSLSNMNFCAIS